MDNLFISSFTVTKSIIQHLVTLKINQDQIMANQPTLGYWDIRGLGQPIRTLLTLAGVEFTDKRYQFGDGNTRAERSIMWQNWYRERPALGLEFANLPYWIDGEVKLTQTLAILKYLARKYQLIATDIITLAKQEMLEQQLLDIRTAFQGEYKSS